VHLVDFPKLETTLTAEEEASWSRLLRLRDAVLAVLERARAAKQIGQSLEADIALHGSVDSGGIDLAKLFIVSHVDLQPADDAIADAVEIEGFGRVGIRWTPARGKKCGRCWQYREEVVEEAELCARCQRVVDSLAPSEVPTA
jgi:isoleucyl-tRNA synthetase